MRLGSACLATLVVLLVLGPSAVEAKPARPAPPPAGCTPTRIDKLPLAAGEVCVHDVLVTQTWNTEEQNHTTFAVADRHATLIATIGHWWPQGPPTAGMMVTLWGQVQQDRTLRVDRWIDLTHGAGPAPAGPYPRVRLLDASSGRVPEHRMVWVVAVPFALIPQNGGDGDIHVQTFTACPSAGLTTETTPPMRGYVDHPPLPGTTSSTDESDEPSNHLGDAPPAGMPVMILGAMRYDYGFGWWEIHPVRAWRFLTPAEADEQARECAGDPIPHLDPNGPAAGGVTVPVPFGFPPCTDGSEFGNLPGYSRCGPQCYVAHTAIGRPETLAGPCAGIAPAVTPSQARFPQRGIAHLLRGSRVPAPELARLEGAGNNEADQARRAAPETMLHALARTYGDDCAALERRAFRTCLLALARLAGGEIRSPAFACRQEPRGRDRRACVAAARRALRS